MAGNRSVDAAPRLIQPDARMHEAFCRMFEDYQASGHHEWCEEAALAATDFPAYVNAVRDKAAGSALSDEWAPTSYFWMQIGDDLVGTLRIRHYLTPAVIERAGHIGYDIAPAFRGRGLGHEILRLGLVEATKLGIGDVLLLCSAKNMASRRIIERHGGTLDRIKDNEMWYWIRRNGG
ncbi:MAG: GNAT family N-acetyltransferase [Luteolibacter sp.]|uniref:GNAT family N-acetyltransferase n=1 Tax=Luteolibacter sp. TaxID=1962973 RepID=UPI00326396F7